MINATKGISGGVAAAGTNIGNAARVVSQGVSNTAHTVTWQRAAKEYNHYQNVTKKYEQVNVFIEAGAQGATNFFKMYFLGKFLGKGHNHSTFFGHNYTGNGNRDDFAKFFGESSGQKAFEFFAITYALGIPDNQSQAFFNMLPDFRDRPKSFTDRISQGHDDGVPGPTGSGNPRGHVRADEHFIRSYWQGLFYNTNGFYNQPLDSLIVGTIGMGLLFGDDLFNRYRALF